MSDSKKKKASPSKKPVDKKEETPEAVFEGDQFDVPPDSPIKTTPDEMTDEELKAQALKNMEEKRLIHQWEDWTVYDLTETMDSATEEVEREKVRKRYIIEDVPDVIEYKDEWWNDLDEAELLSEEEELFCQYYIKNRDTRFNATRSYALAYWHDIDWADTTTIKDRVTWQYIKKSERLRLENMCAACWARKLRKAKVQKRNLVLLNELRNDTVVDWKMLEHILWEDTQASRDMIKEYNKIMGRSINKTIDASQSDLEKAKLFKTLTGKVKDMSKEEVSSAIQDLLTR